MDQPTDLIFVSEASSKITYGVPWRPGRISSLTLQEICDGYDCR